LIRPKYSPHAPPQEQASHTLRSACRRKKRYDREIASAEFRRTMHTCCDNVVRFVEEIDSKLPAPQHRPLWWRIWVNHSVPDRVLIPALFFWRWVPGLRFFCNPIIWYLAPHNFPSNDTRVF
jgi:hypothetical protein